MKSLNCTSLPVVSAFGSLPCINPDCSSEVEEAFLGFDDLSNDRSAQGISESVLDVSQKYNCVEKLITQTHDGAALVASELNRVRAKNQRESA